MSAFNANPLVSFNGRTSICLRYLLASAPGQEIDWEPDIYPSDNLFPSVVMGTTRVDPDTELFAGWGGNHPGDENGVVGAVISGVCGR